MDTKTVNPKISQLINRRNNAQQIDRQNTLELRSTKRGYLDVTDEKVTNSLKTLDDDYFFPAVLLLLNRIHNDDDPK